MNIVYRLRRRAFTLVEIMIVVVIIGLIALLAIPVFRSVRDKSAVSRFANDLRVFRSAIDLFYLESGTYPEDSNTGDMPSELVGYFSSDKFTSRTPVGGSWDVEYDERGITSAIGVVNTDSDSKTEELLEQVDERIDDGNGSTGAFRQFEGGSRYYWVVEE
ncbi:MAG: prepilin-type N-terminal cleavage/methylation domain-containing protein [Verrucomicrobiota bacterium]